MNKNILSVLTVVVGVLILAGAGCGPGTETANQNTPGQKNETAKTEKQTTSKTAQQITNDLRTALTQVFGEAKLTANETNVLGNKGWIGLSYSVGRNPVEADISAINNAVKKIGYDLFEAKTEDSDFGRNTVGTYFSSQHFMTLTYYANNKKIEIMLMPADEARKLIKEGEKETSQ